MNSFISQISEEIEVCRRLLPNTTAQNIDESKAKLSNALINCFNLAQKAVLRGEYYFITSTTIQEIIFTADTLEPLLVDLDPSLTAILESVLEKIKSLKSNLAKFADLNLFVVENLDNLADAKKSSIITRTNFEKLFTKNSKDYLVDEKSGTNEVELFEDLYEINISLAYLDEKLECRNNTILELKKTAEYLDAIKDAILNQQSLQIFKLLKNKADYLIFKIQYRLCHSKEKAVHLGQGIPELKDWSKNFYSGFITKTIDHYSDKDLTREQVLELEKLIDAKISRTEDLNLFAYHFLNRHYTKSENITPSVKETKLEDLRRALENDEDVLRDIPGALSLYDKISIKSIQNLLFNSSVSLKLQIETQQHFENIVAHFDNFLLGKTSKVEPKLLKNITTSTKEFTSDCILPDYYLYKTIVDFLDNLVRHLKRNAKDVFYQIPTTVDVKELRIRAEKIVNYVESLYKENIEQLKSIFNKMRSHEVRPVYLLMHECILPYEWEPSNSITGLFLDSSYTLPNDFDSVEKNFLKWDIYLNTELNPLLSAFDLELTQIAIKNTVTEFEKKAKEAEFRTIQIIAIFVSIATFVLSSVKIFELKSPMESFAIILGLAACFFIFNLFFHFVIVFQRPPKNISLKNISPSILLIIAISVLCYYSHDLLAKEKEQNSIYYDGFKKAHQKDSISIDSLKHLFSSPPTKPKLPGS